MFNSVIVAMVALTRRGGAVLRLEGRGQVEQVVRVHGLVRSEQQQTHRRVASTKSTEGLHTNEQHCG